MPFVYDEQKSAAIDDAVGISVHRSRQFNDDDRLFTYEYSSKEVNLEFDAIVARERRSYTHEGKTFERDQDVAYYVLEPTVRSGYATAWGKSHSGEPLEEARYRRIRAEIREGMFVRGTQGGKVLPPIPDFRVNFINTPGEVELR